MVKIAISGKGGVGKTTLAGILARVVSKKNFKVIAIDADPNPNLALVLGISPEEAGKIVPISENTNLIEEKTGAKYGSFGSVFKMSFKVDDIIERFCIKGLDGVNLLVIGVVRAAGQGCMCPANILTQALLKQLLVKRDEVVIIDMEAGTEHLGRATAKYVDIMLIITDADLKSLETSNKIFNLSKSMGLKKVFVVGNRTMNDREVLMIEKFCIDRKINLLEVIPYDDDIRNSDIRGKYELDFSNPTKGVEKLSILAEKILKNLT